MKKVRLNISVLLSFILLIVFSGCSTQKDRFVNRAYHTINAKYNGYFNARESYREGLKSLKESHRDNYEEILEIFRYGSEDDVGAITSNMDVAYQKSSVVIQRHSMNIRGVEHNPMIDDAYFLIARSHFFKQDYNLAILTFEYIIRQYDTPLKYKSKIWVAKTNNYMGRFDNARQILEIVQRNYEEGVLPEDYYRFFFLVYADHYYKQAKYDKAAPYMEKAIDITKRRRDKTRLVFILGQTYQETGNYANAQEAYARVLRLNPDFDMEFRARINMAMAYDPKVGGGSQIREQLNRMLRQDRNRNYRDQIYYALAKLSENQGLQDEAIEQYIKSTQVSEENNIQKGLSFLRLGQIYFEKEEYYKAHMFYDSTASVLPNNYDGIDEIRNKSNILNDLALNIKIVNMEDSLQRVASLPNAERNRIIDEIIAEEREMERAQRQRERDMMQAGRRDQHSRMMDDGQGGWYFYNPSAMRFGRTEFASRWGDRKQEDLWRISNKEQISSFDDVLTMDETGEPAEGESFEAEPEDRFSREIYLNNLPLKPEQLEESNKRIVQAYYNKGLIYKDRLHNNNKAIEAFETLMSRYPENEHTLYSYYFLYDIYSKINNHEKANFYKNKIVEDFPETDFAKILSNPDYAQNLMEKQNRGNQLYKLSYNAFINEDYSLAIEYCNSADTLELNKELKGQFTYLRALSYGGMGNNEKLINGLNEIVDNYLDLTVYEPAKHLLAYLGEYDDLLMADKAKTDPDTDTRDEDSKTSEKSHPEKVFENYNFKPGAIHFSIFVVNTDNIEIRQFRNLMNNFNREEYADRNLTLSNVYFDDKKQILTVTNFESKQKAEDYLEKVVDSDKLSDYDMKDITHFIIAVENYPTFYREKDLEGYLEFYEYHYSK